MQSPHVDSCRQWSPEKGKKGEEGEGATYVCIQRRDELEKELQIRTAQCHKDDNHVATELMDLIYVGNAFEEALVKLVL